MTGSVRACAVRRAGSTSRTISCASSAGRWCMSWHSRAVTLARPQADIAAALRSGDVRAVIICPSNPVHQRRADPGDPRHARCDQGEWCAGCRGIADHRRAGGQGPDREDDARTRPRGQRRRRRRTLRRSAGWLHRRPRRRRWIGNVGARVTIAKTLMTSLQDREALARVTLDAADALASQR